MLDLDLLLTIAEGAAPAAPGWLSEEGIAAIVSMILAVLTALKAVLSSLGRQQEAARVAAAHQALEKGAATVGALVGAIGDLRRSGKVDPVTLNAFLGQIKRTTADLDVNALLHAVVEAEKAAPATKPNELPATAVEAARAVLTPKEPEKPSLAKRLTGRVA